MIPAVVVFLYVIAVIGGGTTLRAVSGGLVPFWLGGAVVSAVVMCYVLFVVPAPPPGAGVSILSIGGIEVITRARPARRSSACSRSCR